MKEIKKTSEKADSLMTIREAFDESDTPILIQVYDRESCPKCGAVDFRLNSYVSFYGDTEKFRKRYYEKDTEHEGELHFTDGVGKQRTGIYTFVRDAGDTEYCDECSFSLYDGADPRML